VRLLVAMMIKENKYINQVLSIKQFGLLLSGYVPYETLTSVDTIDAQSLVKNLDGADSYHYKKYFEPLESVLFHNSKINKGKEFVPITESRIIQASNSSESAAIRLYRVSDLLKWIHSNIDLNQFNLEMPIWASDYIRDMELNFKKNNSIAGTFNINDLPKTLKLIVAAHLNINWESTDLSTNTGKNNFERETEKFLIEKAKEWEVFLDYKKGNSLIGVGNTNIKTITRWIKPDKERK
jgi:hypothetical protein